MAAATWARAIGVVGAGAIAGIAGNRFANEVLFNLLVGFRSGRNRDAEGECGEGNLPMMYFMGGIIEPIKRIGALLLKNAGLVLG